MLFNRITALCLLFACIECSFIQYGNQYPLWVYESSDYWMEYYSNNCTFINEYYHLQYPHLDLLNISCIENDNPPYSSFYSSSQLLELYYLDNIYNIILFDRNDTINMTKHEQITKYKVVYNINIMINNNNTNSSNLYDMTPTNELPSDCYISAIQVSGLDATYLTICELNYHSNKEKYSMLWILPWSWDSSNTQYIYTCLKKGQYDITCSNMGSNSHFSISGCSDISTAREITYDQIFACPGTFEGGIYSESAESLCNTAAGYHICESQDEAKTLGLTSNICQNKVAINDYEFFAAKRNESSSCGKDHGPGLYGCAAQNAHDLSRQGECTPFIYALYLNSYVPHS